MEVPQGWPVMRPSSGRMCAGRPACRPPRGAAHGAIFRLKILFFYIFFTIFLQNSVKLITECSQALYHSPQQKLRGTKLIKSLVHNHFSLLLQLSQDVQLHLLMANCAPVLEYRSELAALAKKN